MTRRKPRGLKPEEEQLWDKVRHSATPLRPSKQVTMKTLLERPKRKKPQNPTEPIQKFQVGETSTAIPPRNQFAAKRVDHSSAGPIQMDHKRYGKMTRGRLSPERRIDLHGMTIAQAHPALMSFIQGAYGRGNRLVLVITGKGKSKFDDGLIPVRMGVLKRQVPGWLRSGQLSAMVLQVSEAHLKHGGSGAYYVYLRRDR